MSRKKRVPFYAPQIDTQFSVVIGDTVEFPIPPDLSESEVEYVVLNGSYHKLDKPVRVRGGDVVKVRMHA